MWIPEFPETNGEVKYRKIADAISTDIATGKLKVGERLPTQRALAKKISVTIGTIGRAYALAEQRGLISSEVGRGTFIKPPTSPEHREESVVVGQFDLGMNLPPRIEDDVALSGAMERLSRNKNLGDLFHIAPIEGNLRIREAGAKWLQPRVKCSPKSLIVCNGSQSAILACLAAFTKPGDTILAESLSFPGLRAAAEFLSLNVTGIAMDDQGILPDDFARKASNARLLYCNPTLHNPTTATMSDERRREIAQIAKQKNVIVLEDDVYGRLLEDAPLPLTREMPECGILISSVSKSIAVGLRIAFMYAPVLLREKIVSRMRSNQFFVSPLLTEICAQWIDDKTAEKLLVQKRTIAARRQRLAKEILGNWEFRSNPVGNHIWLKMPGTISAATFADNCQKMGVRVQCANCFWFGDRNAPEYVRLSLGALRTDQELRHALQLIDQILRGQYPTRTATY
jgi:DNA-binding transcriptional MocR family regulator